jgi:hypothetical protein
MQKYLPPGSPGLARLRSTDYWKDYEEVTVAILLTGYRGLNLL